MDRLDLDQKVVSIQQTVDVVLSRSNGAANTHACSFDASSKSNARQWEYHNLTFTATSSETNIELKDQMHNWSYNLP